MKTVSAQERLIVALDVSTVVEANKLVEALDGIVSFFKVGMLLQLVAGPDLVNRLIAEGKKIFLDSKYGDVGETIKSVVAQAASMGVSFLTVHGNGQVIRAAVDGRGRSDMKILSVTVLTSLDAFDLKDMGFDVSVEKMVLYRAQKALEAGCDGVIASGQEASAIKDLSKGRLLIVTPGIRPPGTTHDDHKRPSTPTEAIEAGADYLVIGRPITNAPDPRKAATEIIKEMQLAFDGQASSYLEA